jgi:Carboxypeptidase regulatory-like domain
MVCLVLMACLLQAAQSQPAAPPQATTLAPATVRGRITDATNGKALRLARVSLTPEGRGPGLTQRSTRTDAQGSFAFADVPPGRYKLAAAKARYASTELGQTTYEGTGRPLTIDAGDRLERVDIALLRTAAITGRIVDDLGEPVQGATVIAYKPGYTVRGRAMIAGAQASTNDRGEYRIAQLTPGEYYVAAQEHGEGFGAATDADVGLAVTAYPSATDVGAARPIAVRGGVDVTGIDIAMMPVNAATLSGIVLDASGQPAAGVDLQLQSLVEGIGGTVGGAARTAADGGFTFPRLIPGRYELHARRNVRPNEAAIVPITLAGGADAHVTVPLTRGGRMIGMVVLPDGASLDPSTVRLNATPVGNTLIYGTGFGGAIESDWSFNWDFLIGPRVIRAGTLPPGWVVKSVMRGDADVTDVPIVFTFSEVVDNLQVFLSSEKTTLKGRAVDASGKEATSYTAVVFAEEPTRWEWWSRFIATARPDQHGDFTIEGLPPARYLVAAVDPIENNQWRDKAFLESLRSTASPITLEPDGTAMVTLKVVKP